MSKHILHHEDIPDGAGLKESYGPTIPNPKGVSPGSINNFGWLAGSFEIRPSRSIHIEDSIKEQYGNLPGAHGKVAGEKK
jgi:hypothetical protein